MQQVTFDGLKVSLLCTQHDFNIQCSRDAYSSSLLNIDKTRDYNYFDYLQKLQEVGVIVIQALWGHLELSWAN